MKNEKKPHGVQLRIRMVVRDPDGKVIQDTGEKPSQSFVIQFLEYIYHLFNAPALGLATDKVNTEQKIYRGAEAMSNFFRVKAGVNVSMYGLVVGTGDTAEDNVDYKLATQLTEGATAGKITHGGTISVTTAVVGANVDLVLKRAFTNNTGSTITVKEAGMYVNNAWETKQHCIVRDVLAASVEVLDKCSLTLYYTFRTTV